jgi:hypothetical protein
LKKQQQRFGKLFTNIFKKIQEDNKPSTINDSKVFILKPPANIEDNASKNIDHQKLLDDSNQKPKFKIINELTENKNNNKNSYKATKNNNSKQL